MDTAYQEWALRTYGDSAKTKTVTRKKYQRIVKILRGEENSSVENSKFRFWVKAKGFKLSCEPDESDILLVPCNKVQATSNSLSECHKSSQEETIYKKVAVVENFYQIIYDVHVEMDGRSGKHAGQKRTYRAVAEMYAFLPREAVTRFLMSCSDCQKRMHLQGITGSENHLSSSSPSSPSSPSNSKKSRNRAANSSTSALKNGPVPKIEVSSGEDTESNYPRATESSPLNAKNPGDQEEEIDYCLPITTTYLKRMKSLGLNPSTNRGINHQICDSDYVMGESRESDLRPDIDMEEGDRRRMIVYTLTADDHTNDSNENPVKTEIITSSMDPNASDSLGMDIYDNSMARKSPDLVKSGSLSSLLPLDMTKVNSSRNSPDQGSDSEVSTHSSIIVPNKSPPPMTTMPSARSTPIKRKLRSSTDKVTSRPRKMANTGTTASTISISSNPLSCNSNNGYVDGTDYLREEDDDEDEDEENDMLMIRADDKSEMFDPERLKAFNMFVRLFVDENLDRLVPISRQPKDKIQAIIESCTRQFPEFSERARKRIRTYLKSCRRTRRHKTASTVASSSTAGTCQLTNGNGNNSTSKESNGSINSSDMKSPYSCAPSPPSSSYHLSSPLAEQILANACANEYTNAKRMRVGLKPLAVNSSPFFPPSIRDISSMDHYLPASSEGNPMVDSLGSILSSNASPSSESAVQVLKPNASSSLNSTLLAVLTGHTRMDNGDFSNKSDMFISPQKRDQSSQPSSASTSHALMSTSSYNQPTGPSSYPSRPQSSLISQQQQQQQSSGNHVQDHIQHSSSSTDPIRSSNSSAMTHSYSLNPGEMAAVKQLIAGYRESAAFLLRSANELEHLLLQQT
ncbi:nucleolar protein 4 [Brevipalpus obovatus]|uniref:nucleolar protein 4 n=1 Tax=Brevipalpus obovatus TaxID=246614 RepID=UPI003D9DD53E